MRPWAIPYVLRSCCGVGFLASICFASGCHRSEETPPQTAIAAESRASFSHFIVDAHPPGGKQCCTDVAAVGDVNGDGYLDLVIGSEDADGAGLVWYEYPSWQRHDIARGAFTTDGQVVDFDSDGDLDVVVGEVNRGVMWFEQGSTTDEWTAREIGAGYAHDIVVGDLDADGHPDVAVADKKRVVALYRGGAAFRREEVLSRAGEGLHLADLDRDGDMDLLYANTWIERSNTAGQTTWTVHEIDPAWTSDTRIQTAHIDADGKLDVVLSGSEGESRLAWFEVAAGENSVWIRHEIGAESYVGVHSLRVADFDLDGDLDIVAAEMATSPNKRIVVHLNEGNGSSWQRVLLATHGSHNMVVADVDADGDPDLLGKNYEGKGRFIEYWQNRSGELRLVPQRSVTSSADGARWEYQPIDLSRPASDARKFGLLIHDVNQDGLTDVIAGGSIYLNPGSGGQQDWRRIIATAGDIIHVTPVSRFGWPVMLAIQAEALDVVETKSSNATEWNEYQLHSLPNGRTQGFTTVTLPDENAYDLYFTHATSLFRVRVSGDSPRKWPMLELRDDVQEEAVAAGDLDGDGQIDLLAVALDGKRLLWMTAEERGVTDVRPLGASQRFIDRVAIADLNADGRPDIVYTEETQALEYAARIVWLEAPRAPRRMPWKPHTLATLRSVNSLDVQDIDADGRADLIVAEHTDMSPQSQIQDNFTGIFRNVGSGNFQLEVVEVGPHSSHLGAKVLPGRGDDGSFDIVSVGWAQECCVHRWRRVPQTATTIE
jgi:hypothetical protein